MKAILAAALAAALAAPPMALAQSDSGTTIITTQGGPKRVRVPGAEDAAAEAAEPAETATPTLDLLPEAEPEPELQVETVQATEEPEPAEEAVSESTVETTEPATETTTTTVATAEVGDGPFVGDYTIGDPEAPVQIIEYASLTCPHCAAFHRETWPQFKEEFVETGKVGFTLREVYFERFGLWASMTARCAGEPGFYPMIEQFLNKQEEWSRADDVAAAIQQIGRRAGLTGDQLKACLENQDFAKLLVEEYQTNAEADGISSTPSFVIRGPGGTQTVPGNMAYEDFKALVEEAGAGS